MGVEMWDLRNSTFQQFNYKKMLKGLRTILYHVNDLPKAEEWDKNILGIEPYFDESFLRWL